MVLNVNVGIIQNVKETFQSLLLIINDLEQLNVFSETKLIK